MRHLQSWLLGAVLLGCISGCVVSTHGGPGQEPVVPLPPEAPKSEAMTERANEPMEVGARHVLVAYKGAEHARPYVTRSREEAQTLAAEVRQRLLAGEDFAEVAKANSDDAGSAALGGDLGRFRREQMVPEFSDAAFALAPGDVSEVVESAFGFHVIQRTE
jgi:NIMA-interacting peptidyl-prolyl cis-trans isomerase 1